METMAQRSPGDRAAAGESTPLPYTTDSVQALRTAQSSTLTLSQMADQKASMLMGATFLVFSIAISRSLDGHLPWALAVLAVFAFASSLLAAMVVMPSISAPKRAQAEPNLLFFGHFATMDEKEWSRAVLERLKSDDALHRTLLHDLYQNGQVLQRRKYRFLGYAYRTFIAGLVVTLLSFAIELTSGA